MECFSLYEFVVHNAVVAELFPVQLFLLECVCVCGAVDGEPYELDVPLVV